MSLTEIEAAILRLPASELTELMTWIEGFHKRVRENPITDDLGPERFDALISEAYASGEASPLTKIDIDEARRVVTEKIAARTIAG